MITKVTTAVIATTTKARIMVTITKKTTITIMTTTQPLKRPSRHKQ